MAEKPRETTTETHPSETHPSETHPNEDPPERVLSRNVPALDASFDASFAPAGRPVVRSTLPWFKDRKYLVGGWGDASIWRSTVSETVGTCALVFTSGQIGATLMNYQITQIGAYIGISNIILLSTFIYATAPASGGHLNPLITFSAMIAGICPFARGILYIVGQTLGGALAGGLLAGTWGYSRSIQFHGGGCFFDPSIVTVNQVVLNEICSSFVLLFLAYGVGLDPRQALLFGPRLGPLLVGMSLGLVSFSSSGMAPGYTGAQMNPARCFAFGIARRDLVYNWIWWVGPAIASILLAICYNLVPPHHADKTKKPEELRNGGSV